MYKNQCKYQPMIWAVPHIGWGHCCPVWRCLSMAFMFPRQYNWEPLDVTNCCIYCKIMLQIVQEPKAQSPISSGACPGMVRDAQKHHSGTLWRKLHQPLISIFNFHIWCDLEFRSQIVDCFSSHLLGIKIEKRRTGSNFSNSSESYNTEFINSFIIACRCWKCKLTANQ